MIKNLYKDIPNNVAEELFEEIESTENVLIERIISDRHSSPDNFWYDQERNELVFLIEGNATIQFTDNSEVKLSKGDYLKINAHQKHRVKETSQNEKTIWLAIHY